MTRRALTVRLLALWLALGACGCGKLREVGACRAIAHEIDAAVSEVEQLSKQKSVDERRIAKRYAELAKALEPRAIGDKPLAVALREYTAVLHATDVALRQHAEAVKTQSGRVADPRRELERLVKRDHAAVTRIDVECHN